MKTKQDQCQFCGKEISTTSGNLNMQQFSGNDINDVFAQAEKAAQDMLKRKFVCKSCEVIFCLECGNAEGQKRGTGKTHCPACGKVAL